jgi:hypothetical protein
MSPAQRRSHPAPIHGSMPASIRAASLMAEAPTGTFSAPAPGEYLLRGSPARRTAVVPWVLERADNLPTVLGGQEETYIDREFQAHSAAI